jgi:hypothetical protein
MPPDEQRKTTDKSRWLRMPLRIQSGGFIDTNRIYEDQSGSLASAKLIFPISPLPCA